MGCRARIISSSGSALCGQGISWLYHVPRVVANSAELGLLDRFDFGRNHWHLLHGENHALVARSQNSHPGRRKSMALLPHGLRLFADTVQLALGLLHAGPRPPAP